MRTKNPGTRAASRMLLLPVLVLLFAGNILSAGTIEYQAGSVGSDQYHYSFLLDSIQLNTNQQLEIRFDPSIYLSLNNGIAGSDISLTLLQPNNPPGTFGDYAARALVDNASLAGPFSVDVQLLSGFKP